jgi:hypothetical protein
MNKTVKLICKKCRGSFNHPAKYYDTDTHTWPDNCPNCKHTPAPWSVHNNIGKKGEIGVIASAAPCIICTMGNAKAWPEEAKANAHLIAAAPELLEALEVAENTLQTIQQEAEPIMKKYYAEGLNPTMDLIRDAIEKAKG